MRTSPPSESPRLNNLGSLEPKLLGYWATRLDLSASRERTTAAHHDQPVEHHHRVLDEHSVGVGVCSLDLYDFPAPRTERLDVSLPLRQSKLPIDGSSLQVSELTILDRGRWTTDQQAQHAGTISKVTEVAPKPPVTEPRALSLCSACAMGVQRRCE